MRRRFRGINRQVRTLLVLLVEQEMREVLLPWAVAPSYDNDQIEARYASPEERSTYDGFYSSY